MEYYSLSSRLSFEELPEQHISGLPRIFRGCDRDAHRIGSLIEIEGQKGTAYPFLLNHSSHFPYRFRRIEKVENQIVAGVFPQNVARQVRRMGLSSLRFLEQWSGY
jgi:hypothetical protein